MKPFRFPGSITQEHIIAIGLVATEWTRIENHSQILLWNLVGLESRTGRCITQHVSFRGIWDSILSLLEELTADNDDKNEAKDIHRKIDKLRIERNHLVHAIWGISPKSGEANSDEATAITIKARGVLSIDHRNVSIGEMEELINNMQKDGLALANFSEKIKGKYVPQKP